MKKLFSLLTLLVALVTSAWGSTVDDLTSITSATTITMDGINGTAALVDKTLYADGKLLSLGGNGYSNGKGSTTYNETSYLNCYQIKSNRQIALKIGFNATITIVGQSHAERKWRLGTSSAGNEIAESAVSTTTLSGNVDGSSTAQVVYINTTSDLYLGAIIITAAAVTNPVFSLTKATIGTDETSQIQVGTKGNLDGITFDGDVTFGTAGVVTVSATGVVTPVAVGTTTINFNTNAVASKYNASTGNSLTITVTSPKVKTPTFTVYGNKVVKIECATDGYEKIYYAIGNADIKTSGSKKEYTGQFIPESSGTIYAYATKAGAADSDVASQAVTLPVVGDVTGDFMIKLVPDGPAASDTNYGSNTFSKAGYTLVSTASLTNSDTMNKNPHMFKAAKGTFTITPPSDVTIKSIKIFGVSNSDTKTNNVQKENDEMTVTTSDPTLMQRNVIVGDAAVLSEIVMTVASPAEGTAVKFKIGGDNSQARFYVEVYGSTSATSVAITPANDKSTYVTTHALDFSGVAGLTAYVATAAAGGSVTLAEVGAVPAGTPLMLIGTAGIEYTVPVAASADAPAVNMFRAGDGTTTFDGSTFDYILFSDGLFYQIGSGAVPVGKAYLHCTSDPTGAATAPYLTIDFGGTTGIDSVKAADKANGEYYNLNGQRVANPTKGLYIINGRKVVIK